jgi:hypothetical protein
MSTYSYVARNYDDATPVVLERELSSMLSDNHRAISKQTTFEF